MKAGESDERKITKRAEKIRKVQIPYFGVINFDDPWNLNKCVSPRFQAC
jgi:hypothetical protein